MFNNTLKHELLGIIDITINNLWFEKDNKLAHKIQVNHISL